MSYSLGIGISTRNRWKELARTLDMLRQSGLDRLETIVIDDGSSEPMPHAMRERFDWVRFERFERSRGYIAQRNRLAELLTTELYLSLDDDSYPAAAARLDYAAAWLIGTEDAIALAFAIDTTEPTQYSSRGVTHPYAVRHYIGCAHMLKRRLFLDLGGYTESLVHFCEEKDLALKAWKKGFKVYKYPSVIVVHCKSPVGRNAANANRLNTRNLLWVSAWRLPLIVFVLDLWRVPNGFGLFRVSRMLSFKSHRLYRRSVLQGYVEALLGLPQVLQIRDPLTFRQYFAWLKNPVEHS